MAPTWAVPGLFITIPMSLPMLIRPSRDCWLELSTYCFYSYSGWLTFVELVSHDDHVKYAGADVGKGEAYVEEDHGPLAQIEVDSPEVLHALGLIAPKRTHQQCHPTNGRTHLLSPKHIKLAFYTGPVLSIQFEFFLEMSEHFIQNFKRN